MKKIRMTEEQANQYSNESVGFCRHCGVEHHAVEPDAREYTCEACGHNAVFGIEELALMGDVRIVEED